MNNNSNPILVTQPFLPPLEEFQEYLKDIWKSKQLTNRGKYHQLLEKALCDYLGVKYISLFSNGTLALITALQVLKISGEVITTPFSFVATTHSLWWNNIKPLTAFCCQKLKGFGRRFHRENFFFNFGFWFNKKAGSPRPNGNENCNH